MGQNPYIDATLLPARIRALFALDAPPPEVEQQVEGVAADGLPGWAATWLATFQRTGNIRMACVQAGVGRATYLYAYAHRPAFTRAVNLAREDAVDIIEARLREAALKDGNVRAMIAILRAQRPELWAPPAHLQADVQVHGTVQHQAMLDDLRHKLLGPMIIDQDGAPAPDPDDPPTGTGAA